MPGASEIKAGGAYVEVGGKLGPLDKALSLARGKLKAFGDSAVNLGKKFIIAGGAMAAPLGLAIEKAGDYEEQLSKFRAVFKELAGPAEEWVKELSSRLGRSRSDLIMFMATLQDTFVPLGFARDEGLKFSKMLTQLTLDVASFNNKAEPEVLRDFQSALVGNHETVRKYGIIITQASLNQELLNMGIKKGIKEATAQQKVMARLNIIMSGVTDAMGDAERTAGSWANTKRRLTAQIEEVALAIGSHLLPVVTPMLGKMADFVKWTALWIRENRELVLVIAKIATTLLATGTALVAFGATLKLVGTLLSPAGVFGTGLLTLLYFSGALDSTFAKWKEFVEGIKLGGKTVKERMEDLKAIWESLKPIWTDLVAALRATWNWLLNDMLLGFKRIIRHIVNGLADMMAEWAGQLSEAAGNLDTYEDQMKEAFARALFSAVSASAGIKDALIKDIDLLEKRQQVLTRRMTSGWEEVKKSASKTGETIKSLVDKITGRGPLGALLDKLPSMTFEKLSEMGAGIGAMMPALAVPGAAPGGGVVGTFSGAAAELASPGSRIMEKQLDELKMQTQLLQSMDNKLDDPVTGRFAE